MSFPYAGRAAVTHSARRASTIIRDDLRALQGESAQADFVSLLQRIHSPGWGFACGSSLPRPPSGRPDPLAVDPPVQIHHSSVQSTMRLARPPFAVIAAVLALLLSASPAAAQGTDLIRGRVTDPQGAPLAGVRIEATSAESGLTRTGATNADGRYTIAFPDGGGRYTVRASTVGRQASTATVARQADEEVLIADFRLAEQAVLLEAVSVEADRGAAPGRGDVGGQERTLPSEIVNRLPLENTDAASLAALSPGVVSVGGDSASGRAGFSVGGQESSQNQVTLDGSSFSSRLSGGESGGSPLSVPQEGVRGTQVVTSTFDVSRGQFAGGLVATTTRGGTNRAGGSLSWQLRDQSLQSDGGNPQLGQGYTQHRLSGGFGGPIVRNRLFYFLSFTWQHRSDDLYALTPRDPLALQRFGVTPQAVDTFLATLSSRYGLTGRTGDYARTGDALSLLARTDLVLSQRHTLALRGHLNTYGQENARIGFLETLENGGEVGSRGGGAIATLSSRLGDGWVNELRASVNVDRRDQTPYEELPEGRVQVASALAGAGRGFSAFVFGGDRSLPSLSRERTVEVANELSMLIRDTHRVKAGILLNANAFQQEQASNRLGSFEFESLDAFAEGRPYRFTRQLSARVTEGSGLDAAAWLGDTWRPRAEVQVTGGVRLEASRFGERPALNPAIQERFGYRTDHVPGEVHASPRLGFSWRLSEQGAPLRLVRGGVGEFRGRAPYSLFAAALEQTGLPGGETQIDCVGAAAPVPDWRAYLADPSTIPTECVGGGVGRPVRGVPSVTVFEEGFSAPRAWRASLGYQTQLFRRLRASLDVSYSLGVAQMGVRDLNLRAQPAFTLEAEDGRPVFAPAAAIQPSSAAIPLFASRVDPALGYVLAVGSGLRNRTAQATVGLQGILGPRILLATSYTLARSRDQGSFGGGSPLGGFSAVTRGDPNAREWATSDRERRHSLVATLGMPVGRALEVSFIGRASSGTPFTPLVGRDVNGDGARNDAAFVFGPAAVAGDTALAAGMQRLLGSASGRVRACLEAQTGEVARRNSCRGEWSTNFDLRATFRPTLPRLGRRLSVSLDAFNLAAGLDELLHDELRGWGQSAFRPDNVLLVPDSFDVAARRYLYRVNENFGSRRTAGGFGGFGLSPFQVQLSARIVVGAEQPGGGGFAGRGGPGGPGGPGGFDPELVLDRMLPEPISPMILLRDTLRLTDEQVARLQAISDTLQARNDTLREQIRAAFPQGAAGAGLGEAFQRVQPQVQEGRRNVQQALTEAEAVMTREQWRRVPAALRNALGAFGAEGGRRGGGGRPPE
jgi:hypothetical protein